MLQAHNCHFFLKSLPKRTTRTLAFALQNEAPSNFRNFSKVSLFLIVSVYVNGIYCLYASGNCSIDP